MGYSQRIVSPASDAFGTKVNMGTTSGRDAIVQFYWFPVSAGVNRLSFLIDNNYSSSEIYLRLNVDGKPSTGILKINKSDNSRTVNGYRYNFYGTNTATGVEELTQEQKNIVGQYKAGDTVRIEFFHEAAGHHFVSTNFGVSGTKDVWNRISPVPFQVAGSRDLIDAPVTKCTSGQSWRRKANGGWECYSAGFDVNELTLRDTNASRQNLLDTSLAYSFGGDNYKINAISYGVIFI